jgi:hypothetical protein
VIQAKSVLVIITLITLVAATPTMISRHVYAAHIMTIPYQIPNVGISHNPDTLTTGLIPAGADEISAATAKVFGEYSQELQALKAQAKAIREQFTQNLAREASSYAASETANAPPTK